MQREKSLPRLNIVSLFIKQWGQCICMDQVNKTIQAPYTNRHFVCRAARYARRAAVIFIHWTSQRLDKTATLKTGAEFRVLLTKSTGKRYQRNQPLKIRVVLKPHVIYVFWLIRQKLMGNVKGAAYPERPAEIHQPHCDSEGVKAYSSIYAERGSH